MATIRHILEVKGRQVHTTLADAPVLDAIRTMADQDIGALVVVEDSRPVGIITERHYARDVFLKGRASPTTRVGDIMQRDLVTIGPDETVERCMGLMTERRVRHLPVMDDGRLAGIVSIGDLVKSIIADQQFTIEQLQDYIRS
ncbi:MAG: CBS domain-containing protein [Alphaproteobacteria bacterium]